MNTLQIAQILKSDTQLNKMSLGVFACDGIPTRATPQTCFVANTEPRSRPGEHWVGFYVNGDCECTYFDSYGSEPRTAFLPYLKTCQSYTWNKKQLQSDLSTSCGQYCILYLTLRSRGFKHSQILEHFDENLYENDELVTDWLNDSFNVDLEPLNADFVIAQLSRSRNP